MAPPLSPAMMAALRDLLSGELSRQGPHFVTQSGTKHKASTIGALALRGFCRICKDRQGHRVARLNDGPRSGSVREQVCAMLGAEADVLAAQQVA